jgi:predicted RNA binding protein with dsRBD fold (UPF0201 family)
LTSIKIRARIQPTEDPIKVLRSVRNIFGEKSFKIKDSEIIGDYDGVETLHIFRNVVFRDRIRDTVRRMFIRWRDDNQIRFGLNRQAAFAGHISFNLKNEDPMGPIEVVIKGDIERVIHYLCS